MYYRLIVYWIVRQLQKQEIHPLPLQQFTGIQQSSRFLAPLLVLYRDGGGKRGEGGGSLQQF